MVSMPTRGEGKRQIGLLLLLGRLRLTLALALTLSFLSRCAYNVLFASRLRLFELSVGLAVLMCEICPRWGAVFALALGSLFFFLLTLVDNGQMLGAALIVQVTIGAT